MPGIRLSCPHCGAVLNFAQEIPAGTAVACLICNQAFSAPAVPVAAAPPQLSRTIPVAAAPRPVTQQASQTAARRVVARRAVAPGERKASAPGHPPARTSGGRGGLGIVAVIGVALLLPAGLAYLFYANVLADRLHEGKTGADAPQVLAQATAPSDKGTGIEAPSNAVEPPSPAQPSRPKGDSAASSGEPGDDVDVADLKKPKKPEPPPVLNPKCRSVIRAF